MPLYLFPRLMVRMLRVVTPLLAFPQPVSFVGPGASLSMGREILGQGVKRVMLITDPGLMKLGLAKLLIDLLEEGGAVVDVFSEIEPDPSVELVLRGVARLDAFKPDAVIAMGGGSSIDGAKSMLLCQANHCQPAQLKGIWLYALPRQRTLPFFAIPTTAGTGSEVTIAAVVSDTAAKLKFSIIDPKLVPGMVALDPVLHKGLPPFITAPTGMDALTHAVEAYISSMATHETDRNARMATASIVRNLPLAYSDGQNLKARERMAVASCLAGMAFTRAGVGYVHAIAHQLGGIYHLPHGLVNAIVLPSVLEFSKSHCAQRLAELARVAGLGNKAASDADLANVFIAHIRELNRLMAIPTVVKELKRDDFKTIVDRAFAEAHGTYGVPRYMNRDQAYALLTKLLPVH